MSETRPLTQLGETELLDTLYSVLADRKRRRILRYLSDHVEPVSVPQLATELATLEYGSEASALQTEQPLHTHISLLHVHLPVLDDAGMVDWDRNTDTVAISSDLQELVVTTTGNVLDISVSAERVK
jgi:DNA-binding transcriptional ArsR family regulator